MEVRFDKKEKTKTILSSVFLSVILSSMLLSFLKETEIAMLIFGGVIFIPLIRKSISLWIFLGRKKDTPYIILSKDKMVVDSFRDGNVEIDLKDIVDIKLDEDTLEVYANRTIQEKKGFFHYFMPNMEHMYQFPSWGKKEEMKALVDNMKRTISCTPQVEDIAAYSNLCGAYLFIMAGIPFLFVLTGLISVRFEYGMILLSILTLVELFMHRLNDTFLTQAKCEAKKVLRCMGLSAWIAQFIIVSCEMQEKIMKTKPDVLQKRPDLLLPLFGIYVVVFLLYMPQNAVGKKLIVFMHNRKISEG